MAEGSGYFIGVFALIEVLPWLKLLMNSIAEIYEICRNALFTVLRCLWNYEVVTVLMWLCSQQFIVVNAGCGHIVKTTGQLKGERGLHRQANLVFIYIMWMVEFMFNVYRWKLSYRAALLERCRIMARVLWCWWFFGGMRLVPLWLRKIISIILRDLNILGDQFYPFMSTVFPNSNFYHTTG